jgi:hypothetical protein
MITHPDESYYRDGRTSETERLYAAAPITARITPMLATIERSPLTQLAAGLLIALGCALLGWYARGLWGPIVDNRGWAALVVFSVAGSVYMVNYSNRRSA